MVCICPSDFLTSRRAFPGPPSRQRAEVGCHRVSGSYRNDLNIRQRSQPRLGTADAFPDASKRNCAEQCRGRGRKWVVEQHTGKQRLASFLEVPVRYRESPYLMNLVRDTSNRGGFFRFYSAGTQTCPCSLRVLRTQGHYLLGLCACEQKQKTKTKHSGGGGDGEPISLGYFIRQISARRLTSC